MKKYLSYAATAIYVILIVICLININDFSTENILHYSPKSKTLAALFILFLYALKSISIVFPCIVLQIASGMLFPLPIALLINFAGVTIDFIIPYYIGKASNIDKLEKRIEKNKKAANIISGQKTHPFFISFFLRVISCLPADIVSMYFGALGLPFKQYYIASMLGTMPSMIPVTFVGESIRDIHSRQFLISLVATLISSAISIISFYIYNKYKKKPSGPLQNAQTTQSK